MLMGTKNLRFKESGAIDRANILDVGISAVNMEQAAFISQFFRSPDYPMF
jgi:hypothetical protein